MPGVSVCDDEAAMTNVEFHYFCGHEQFQPEVLVHHARLAEEAGFDGVFVSEHFHPWVDDVGAAGYAFSTLAAMAQATERVRLITGVIAPIFRHHPAIVAQAAATIDRISGGRFELGIGTGENINEGPLGFSFGNFSERIGRIRKRYTSSGRCSRAKRSHSKASTTAPNRPASTARRFIRYRSGWPPGDRDLPATPPAMPTASLPA